MPTETTNDARKIPAAPLFILNGLLSEYYRKIRWARKNNRRIAWATIGIPQNLLYAMDILPVYPQFHAAFQSARGKARHILENIEGKYAVPHDICGEVKSMMGTILSGERLSFGLPEPDVVISGNGACGAAAKGLAFLGRHLNVPLFFCDFPFVSTDRAGEHAREYVDKQLEAIIKSLEKAYGTKFDEAKYRRLSAHQLEAAVVWREILKLLAHEPAPVSALDLYFFFIPMIMLEPNEAFTDLLIRLYNALSAICRNHDRRSEGKAEAPREIRLLWDMLPVYHKMDFFKDLFQAYNAKVVLSTYLIGNAFYPDAMDPAFEYPLDRGQVGRALKTAPRHRIEQFRDIFLEQDANRPIEYRKQLIAKAVRDFDIHGVVLHMDRTCRPMSLPQYDLMKYIQETLNLPAALFHADSMDERYFSEAQISTRLETFLDGLKSNRP